MAGSRSQRGAEAAAEREPGTNYETPRVQALLSFPLHSRFIMLGSNVVTLETRHKVAFCPRGKPLHSNIQIYL